MRSRMLHLATSVLVLSTALVATGTARASHNFGYSGTLTLSGASEVPSNGSTATGTAIIKVDTDNNVLYYNITYSGLSSAETGAHIHGFAAAGTNAAVIQPLPAGTSKVGSWTYLQADEANILAGLTYINVHSTNFPGGEIRAQIVLQQVPGTSGWGLVVLALVLAFSAAFVLRRRRSSPAA